MSRARVLNIESRSRIINGATFDNIGSGYSTFLKANMLEEMEVTINFTLSVYADLDSTASFYSPDTVAGKLVMPGFDFVGGGFEVGMAILIMYSNGTVNGYSTITSIDGDTLYTAGNYTSPGNINTNTLQMVWAPTGVSDNDITTLEFAYNILPNGDNFSDVSQFTGTNQKYVFRGLEEVPATLVTGTPLGLNNAWINTTLLTCEYVNDVPLVDPVNYYANGARLYQIKHRFLMNNFWLEGENFDYVPQRYQGTNTCGYFFNIDFYRTNGAQNRTANLTYTTNGSIGWFNESFNGLPHPFEITNLSYKSLPSLMPLSGLEVGSNQCRVDFSILNYDSNFTNYSRVHVGICKLPSDYTNSVEYWQDVWNYRMVAMNPLTGVGYEGVFQPITVTLASASQINVRIDFTFDADFKANISNGDKYIIFANVAVNGDNTNIFNQNDTTLRSCLLVDYNEAYVNTDVEGQLTLTDFRLYNDGIKLGVDDGFTSLKCFNESELMAEVNVNLLHVASKIESVKATLGAIKTSEGLNRGFEIQSVNIPFAPTVVGGVQEVDTNTNRGYSLPANYQGNLLTFENTSSGMTNTNYLAQIGFKINWQDWLNLPNADVIFYDKTEPFFGLNQKTSRYSLQNGYDIYIWLDFFLNTGGQLTTYRCISRPIEVTDYELNHAGDNTWVNVYIETFDEEGNNLNGAILKTANTVVKLVATPLIPLIDPFSHRGCLRIEVKGQGGFAQDVISTQFQPLPTSIFQPVNGLIYAKKYVDLGNFVIEAKLDYTKLDQSATYVLSGEVNTKEADAITGAYSIGHNKLAYN